MKIKAKTLIDFLNKVKMGKGQEIHECVFNFEKAGLKIDANSVPKQVRVMGWLKTGAFKEYQEIGKLGVNELEQFVGVLGRFKDEIILTQEGNLLTIKGKGKSVDVELVDVSFISTDSKEPNLEFTDTFKLPPKKIQEIFTDVTLNKDSVIQFETVEKKVKISNTGKYKFQHVIQADTCKGGVLAKFGEPLIAGIIKLEGELEVSMATEYPMKVLEKTENSIITVIVAPRANEE